MNILYHHRTQGGGAEGVHIREIVRALKGLGHNVRVVSPPGVDPFRDGKEKTGESRKTGFKKRIILSLPQIFFEFLEIAYNLWAYRAIKRQIKEKQAGVMYERYSFFCCAGVYLAEKFKIPIILEVNEISGIKRQRGQVLVRLCQRFEKYIFKKADALIVVSDFLKGKIMERGLSGDKIFVIPNAVNPDDFDSSADPSGIKERYKLNGKTILCFIGMFSRWDRLDFLLEVFKKVHLQEDGAHLLLVGDGIQRGDLERKTRELEISASVTFTGEVSRKDIPCLIAASDICLLSGSNPFGSPIALFEYMIMGKPVVVPRYGPIESIVRHNHDGLLFEPDNEQDFKKSIESLMHEEKKREILGRNARDKILSRHLWRNNAETVMEIYEGIGE